MTATLHEALPEFDATRAHRLDDRIDARVRALLAEEPTTRRKLALVASKGSLDWAYPPLMMANNAAKKGWEVGIFFTFYGLNVLHKAKHRRLQVSPVGNPAMPMPAVAAPPLTRRTSSPFPSTPSTIFPSTVCGAGRGA